MCVYKQFLCRNHCVLRVSFWIWITTSYCNSQSISGKNYDHSSLMAQTQKMESQVICLNPVKKKTVSEVIGFIPSFYSMLLIKTPWDSTRFLSHRICWKYTWTQIDLLVLMEIIYFLLVVYLAYIKENLQLSLILVVEIHSNMMKLNHEWTLVLDWYVMTLLKWNYILYTDI